MVGGKLVANGDDVDCGDALSSPGCVLSWLSRYGLVEGEEAVVPVLLVLRVEFVRETAADGGREEPPRDDLERAEEVEGAADARREMAGEGGAGRVDERGEEETSGMLLLLLLLLFRIQI